MPTYYIMDKQKNMAETVNDYMPTDEEIKKCKWRTEEEIKVYFEE